MEVRGMRQESEMIKAMKQALEALEDPWKAGAEGVADAIIALRAAIAEASMQRLTDVQQEMEQEPVAWIVTTEMQDGTRRTYPLTGRYKDVRDCCDFGEPVPLYTHPPRREWVGLTDEEMRQAAQAMNAEPLAEGWKELIKFARAIEAKLKEKNG
jgi:hypothetical protein